MTDTAASNGWCSDDGGMPLKRDHLYIIPPGTYLSVGNGTLIKELSLTRTEGESNE